MSLVLMDSSPRALSHWESLRAGLCLFLEQAWVSGKAAYVWVEKPCVLLGSCFLQSKVQAAAQQPDEQRWLPFVTGGFHRPRLDVSLFSEIHEGRPVTTHHSTKGYQVCHTSRFNSQFSVFYALTFWQPFTQSITLFSFKHSWLPGNDACHMSLSGPHSLWGASSSPTSEF